MIKESFLNETGKLSKLYKQGIEYHLKKSIGKLITLSVQIQLPTRTILQNKYYWGVIIKMLSEEIGYEPEIMHEYMKKLFLGVEKYDMPDGTTMERLKSTTDCNTVEIETYFRDIRNWSGEFLNCYIPLPNETELDYTKYEAK